MPNVIFAPNRTESDLFGDTLSDFRSEARSHRLKSWSCKKTAQPNDIYLFYFAAPLRSLVGIGVCADFPDPDGVKKKGWTNRQKMFFCPFKDVHVLKNTIHEDELKKHEYLAEWWSQRPYRGRPKSISEPYAPILIQLIADRNRAVSKLLRLYVSDSLPTTSGSARKKAFAERVDEEIEVLEGTEHEVIVRNHHRSAKLRDAKIAQAKRNKRGRLICEVPGCGFDFYEVYGELGRDYIHVHHRKSLAKRRRTTKTRLNDLFVVCANCHAMIHRGGKCRSLNKLIPTV